MKNSEDRSHHICPWWMGYFLASPIRQLFQDPRKITGPYIRQGMHVLEIGPGMGFFTLPMAKLVGTQGRIICVEVQEKMMAALDKRVKRAGLENIVQVRSCRSDSLGIEDIRHSVDFALLFAVVHEIENTAQMFRDVHASMRSSGLLLMSEPEAHVSREEYNKSLETAIQSGFEVVSDLQIRRSYSNLLKKVQSEIPAV